jgi:hypothetical protein
VVLSLLLRTEREELSWLHVQAALEMSVVAHAVVLQNHEPVLLVRRAERLCETGRGRSGEEGDDESGAHLTKKLGTPSKKGVLVRYRRRSGDERTLTNASKSLWYSSVETTGTSSSAAAPISR